MSTRNSSSRKNLVGSAALLLAPTLAFVLLDITWRASRLARFAPGDWQDYGLACLLSLLIWGSWLFLMASLEGSVKWILGATFALTFGSSLGAQAYFFQQYNAYINLDVSRFATNFSESVIHQIWADFANYFSFNLPALLAALTLLWVSRGRFQPLAPKYRVLALVVPLLLSLSFVWPVHYRRRQASPPDVLFLHATGGLLATQFGLSKNSHKLRPRARNSVPVLGLRSRLKRKRNVVFIILESVRQDAVCNAYDPECRRTEATNHLFPRRYPLSQMRSLTSSTAISMAVLWSGLAPTESRDSLHSVPLLFDYAREAGFQTAYWTSQNIMFGNMRLWLQNLGVDSLFTGTDVDPESDIDMGASEDLFAERAISELSKLKEPFFLTIQLSNGHYPYLVRRDGPQPFQPSSTSKAPEDNKKFFNHYQNAIYQQDQHLARILRSIRGQDWGSRTVLLYTSDHGEAFREHHQMGHTFSVLDEEILVPAWIEAPPGTLSSSEEEMLRLKENAFVFHPDLTATALDLLGLWDQEALLPFQEAMLGRSLLRPEAAVRSFPMTNCSALWSCAFENWGYMRGSMKLEAREWDQEYHCWDLNLDPEESVNLGVDACGDLSTRAQKVFRRLPGKKD